MLKYIRPLLLSCVPLVFAGCGVSGSAVPEVRIVYGPDEHGVICYRTRYGGATFSCVKVK